MPRFLLARLAAPLCRPSPEECVDYAWFRERLAEPGLLDCAVGVKAGGATLLAVPVGKSRSGGYLSVGTVADAVRIWWALRGQPGFPRVRLGLSVHRDTCHTVGWGPRQPWDDGERGRYFGYSPSAIDSFLRRGWASDPPPQEATTVLASSRSARWTAHSLELWGKGHQEAGQCEPSRRLLTQALDIYAPLSPRYAERVRRLLHELPRRRARHHRRVDGTRLRGPSLLRLSARSARGTRWLLGGSRVAARPDARRRVLLRPVSETAGG